MSRLNNQVALITGGGRGIGAAIALAYAREGAKVVLIDLNEANANTIAGEIRASGSEAEVFIADVSDPAQSTAMIQHTAGAESCAPHPVRWFQASRVGWR